MHHIDSYSQSSVLNLLYKQYYSARPDDRNGIPPSLSASQRLLHIPTDSGSSQFHPVRVLPEALHYSTKIWIPGHSQLHRLSNIPHHSDFPELVHLLLKQQSAD